MFLRSFLSTLFITVISLLYSKAQNEWRIVETLAEQNPYIVALINSHKDYVCSGTIIGKQTILTSGDCISIDPKYVAVGLAVINKKNLANLLDVIYTQLHADYTYIINTTDPSLARIHSNIGLVFVAKPVLDQFLAPATIGSYFASELTDIALTTVGYGRNARNQDVFVLQYQNYNQSPCANPRWYYCICGTEIASATSTHGKDFGNGAPILYENEVVCLSATSTGAPILKSAGIKYNIFTVIGAYMPWMEKTEKSFKARKSRSSAISEFKSSKINKRNRKKNKAEHHFDNDRTQLYIVFIFLVIR